MIRSYPIQVSFLATAIALLLASTQLQRPDSWSLAGLYAYWLVRVFIEAGLFVAFAELLGRLPVLKPRIWLTAILAAIVSLVPFALSITALDLILGLPELGGSIGFVGTPEQSLPVPGLGEARITSFLLELVYLSDNHLTLCLLLSVPKVFQTPGRQRYPHPGLGQVMTEPRPSGADPAAVAAGQPSEEPSDEWFGNGYQRHLDGPLNGPLLRVEAQEHYVRLISPTESRMVLYRFNDIVSELSQDEGLQVHRSHWVAYAAVERTIRENGRQWLALTDGSKIPVSRKYAEDVQRSFSKLRQNAKKAVN